MKDEDLVICRKHLQATVSIDTPILYAVSAEAFAFCNTSENNQGIAMLPDPKDLFRPGAYRERVAKRCEQRRTAERHAKANELQTKAAERQAKAVKCQAKAAERRHGRPAAQKVVLWAYERRMDGVKRTAQLHPGKVNVGVFRNEAERLRERRTWCRQLLATGVRSVTMQLAMKRNVTKVERDQSFWEDVARYVFRCYEKTGTNPPASVIQEQLDFAL